VTESHIPTPSADEVGFYYSSRSAGHLIISYINPIDYAAVVGNWRQGSITSDGYRRVAGHPLPEREKTLQKCHISGYTASQ